MHKGYTINYFIGLVGGVTNAKLKNVGIANLVSPRLGASSQAFAALNTFLGGNLNAIVNGNKGYASLGITPRARILKALKNRKKFGSVTF